jgi:hydroxymethylpyrimidine/phosphomethylpyrimidine kinase
MKKALTIAGFDPSGGAGLQADLKVFHALGVYSLSAVATLTTQNTQEVDAVQPVDERFLKKQLEVLLSDLVPDVTKIGMLLTAENVRVVAAMIKKFDLKHVVLDPVLVSSSGKKLAQKDVPVLIREKILPLCAVITPNISEASILSGVEIRSAKDMEKVAVILRQSGTDTVIITGGHCEGAAVDILYDGEFRYLKARKRRGEYHGTGCRFSPAIASFLALGYAVPEAAKKAKEFMSKAFNRTFAIRNGMCMFDI